MKASDWLVDFCKN